MVPLQRFICLIILSIFLILGSSHSASSQTIKENGVDSVDVNSLKSLFKDKIIGLKIDASSALETKSDSVYIHEAEILKLGDRFFIVGKTYIPDHPAFESHQYRKNTVMGTAWENVSQFVAYNEEQYTTWLNDWTKKDNAEKQ